MDKAALVEKDIEFGRKVTEDLDRSNIPVTGSLWFYNPEASEWRLIVATPFVDERGPKAAYVAIQRALKAIDLPLRNVSVISPNDRLIRLLRTVVRTGRKISGIRFTHNTINNVFIEDVYIYRLQ